MSMTSSTKTENLATKSEGPYKIIELFENWAILTGKNGKCIQRNIFHLKPFFAPTPLHLSLSWSEIVEKGEGSGATQTFDNAGESDAVMVTLITSVLCEEASTHEKSIDQKINNQINEDLRPHLLEVALKILINQDLDFDPLTSEERKFWNSYSQCERSMLLTGNPIGIPEWRTRLCSMPGPAPTAPPAPAAPPPVPAPPPPILAPAPPIPSTSAQAARPSTFDQDPLVTGTGTVRLPKPSR